MPRHRKPGCPFRFFNSSPARTALGEISQRDLQKFFAGRGEGRATTALRKPFASARKEAKIEGFQLHDLRHTRATRIVRNTGNLAVAKEALKHRSMAKTLRYAHVLDDDVRNALEERTSQNIPTPSKGRNRKSS